MSLGVKKRKSQKKAKLKVLSFGVTSKTYDLIHGLGIPNFSDWVRCLVEEKAREMLGKSEKSSVAEGLGEKQTSVGKGG